MKSLIASAALAAIGFAGVAYAEDGKANSSQAATPKAMTDAEMDKVTAGVEGADHLIIQSNVNNQVFHVNSKDSAHSTTNGYTQYERNTIRHQ